MSEVKPKPRRPVRHMTSAQKAEAIALWKAGTHTVDDLAKKFKKDRSTLLRLFKESGAEKGALAEETAEKVQKAVEENIVSDAMQLANRIRETKEEHYKMANGIAKLTWSLLAKAKQENRPIGSLDKDMKALQLAANTLKIAREERYAVLGISASDDHEDKPLPDLVVQELTAEDIKQMHQQKMIDNEDLGNIELDDLGDEAVIDDRVEEGEDDERVEEGEDGD